MGTHLVSVGAFEGFGKLFWLRITCRFEGVPKRFEQRGQPRCRSTGLVSRLNDLTLSCPPQQSCLRPLRVRWQAFQMQ